MSNEAVPARRWLDRDLVVGAAVTVLAGLVRVAFIASTPASAPLSDMAEYRERALYLFQHGQLYPDSWRMPGLPVALSAAFIAVGHASLEAARGLNVLAGMLAAALTYGLARRSAPSGWAAGAAAVVAVYPSLIVYSNLVATESLAIVPNPRRTRRGHLPNLPRRVCAGRAGGCGGAHPSGERRLASGRDRSRRSPPPTKRGDSATCALPSRPARCASRCSRGGGTTTPCTTRSCRSTRPVG